MTEKSRLLRARKEVVHSIKAQLQDIELFPAREFEMVIDGCLWPSSREEGHKVSYWRTE